MPESTETIIARMDERLKTNNDMTIELLKIVKGDNGEGLMTKVAVISKEQETCPAKISVRWLTWGFRSIALAIIGGFFWFIRR